MQIDVTTTHPNTETLWTFNIGLVPSMNCWGSLKRLIKLRRGPFNVNPANEMNGPCPEVTQSQAGSRATLQNLRNSHHLLSGPSCYNSSCSLPLPSTRSRLSLLSVNIAYFSVGEGNFHLQVRVEEDCLRSHRRFSLWLPENSSHLIFGLAH